MKNLYNALLLKQLYQLKHLGYNYSNVVPYKENESSLALPSKFDDLASQANDCHLCELSKSRHNVVFGEGDLNADIFFIGESPGTNEDNEGKPFLGRSGELLTKMIENVLNIKRQSVYIANIVKCRPPDNRAISSIEALTCKPYIFKQIELIKPKLIVALGETAYYYLTGDETKINKIRGTMHTQDGYTIIPTYHPSYLLRNPSAKKEVFEDLKKVKELMKKLSLY